MPCAALNSYNHLSTSQVFSVSTYFSLSELKKSKVCLMHLDPKKVSSEYLLYLPLTLIHTGL